MSDLALFALAVAAVLAGLGLLFVLGLVAIGIMGLVIR